MMKTAQMHFTSSLLGETVFCSQGEDVGRIEDVIVDLEQGRISGVILAGVDSLLSVPSNLLERGRDQIELRLKVPREKLKALPVFNRAKFDEEERSDSMAANGLLRRGARPFSPVKTVYREGSEEVALAIDRS